MRMIFIFICSIVFSGCSSTKESIFNRPLIDVIGFGAFKESRLKQHLLDSQDAYEKAVVSINKFKDMQFAKIKENSRHKFTIDRLDEAYLFAFGNAFFEGYELPTNKGSPYSLRLESRLHGPGFNVTTSSIGYPVLIFLNENFETVRIENNLQFRFSTPISWKDGMETEVSVSDSREKYLIIAISPKKKSETFNFRRSGSLMPVTTGNSVTMVPTSGSDFQVPYNYEGLLGLTFKTK